MRLISQNGMLDVSYELCSIYVDDFEEFEEEEYCIFYDGVSDRISGFLASYSSKAKALKVMEMVRNAYCGLPIIMKNVDISDGVIETLKDLKKNGIIFQDAEEKPSVEYVNNTYFKFPKDEDVEA